jgi:hypothetical protein
MTRLLLPRRFSSQPTQAYPVDWQNPLTQGLALATYPTEDTAWTNLVSGLRFTDPYSPPSFGQSSFTKWGRGRTYYDGNSRQYVNVTPGPVSTGRQTLLILVRPRVLPVATRNFVNAGQKDGWDLNYASLAADGRFSVGSTNAPALLSDSSVTLGEHYAVTAICDVSSISAKQYFFVNGVKQQATSSYAGIGPKRIEQVVLGNSNTANMVDIFAVFVWTRALSDDEVRQVNENPYQLFGASRFVPYAVPTAAPGSGSISGSGTSQASAAAALTTSVRLAGAAAVVASGAGAMSTALQLGGTATAQASGSASLAGSAVAFSGAATAQASAPSTLSSAIRLVGAAAGQAAGAGALATGIRLAGAATAQSIGSANLAGVAATLIGNAVVLVAATGALSTKIRLAGAAAGVALALGALDDRVPPPDGDVIDVSLIPADRIVVFEGSGSRTVVFEGSGSRVVIFEGSEPRVRIGQMNIRVPEKLGEKWTVDRDPDEISYYAADITQELLDRNTTADPSKITPVLFGVVLLDGPELQVATIDGVERTFVVVKLGGVDEPLPADWRWVARVSCLNGERFDKTTWFNKVDP